MKKCKLLAIAACTSFIISCGNGGNENNEQDTGNVLNDTFPARPIDSIAIDSFPQDGTRIDSGKGDWQ